MTEPEQKTERQPFTMQSARHQTRDDTPAADSIADEVPPSEEELVHWGQFGEFVQLALRTPSAKGTPSTPQQIGPFHIIRVLAQGGNGTVYLAQDQALPRTVAIKVPRADLLHVKGTRQRFLQEAKLVAGL